MKTKLWLIGILALSVFLLAACNTQGTPKVDEPEGEKYSLENLPSGEDFSKATKAGKIDIVEFLLSLSKEEVIEQLTESLKADIAAQSSFKLESLKFVDDSLAMKQDKRAVGTMIIELTILTDFDRNMSDMELAEQIKTFSIENLFMGFWVNKAKTEFVNVKTKEVLGFNYTDFRSDEQYIPYIQGRLKSEPEARKTLIAAVGKVVAPMPHCYPSRFGINKIENGGNGEVLIEVISHNASDDFKPQELADQLFEILSKDSAMKAFVKEAETEDMVIIFDLPWKAQEEKPSFNYKLKIS